MSHFKLKGRDYYLHLTNEKTETEMNVIQIKVKTGNDFWVLPEARKRQGRILPEMSEGG